MLVVSSIRIAAVMLTLVGIVDAGLYEVDSFNDRTDGHFRRRPSHGGCPFVLQELMRPFFIYFSAVHGLGAWPYRTTGISGRPKHVWHEIELLLVQKTRRPRRRVGFPAICALVKGVIGALLVRRPSTVDRALEQIFPPILKKSAHSPPACCIA